MTPTPGPTKATPAKKLTRLGIGALLAIASSLILFFGNNLTGTVSGQDAAVLIPAATALLTFAGDLIVKKKAALNASGDPVTF